MFLQFLAIGILIGFLASLPVGPVSILIIQRTINRNRQAGFYSGVGATLSDTLYAAAAGFGMALLIGYITENEFWIRLIGSAVLVLFGGFIFFSSPGQDNQKGKIKKNSHIKDMLSSFAITVSNPLIIFMYFAIFSGFGIALSIDKPIMALSVMLGFIVGALAFRFALTGVIDLFKNKFSTNMVLWINRISGASIVLFVLASLILWMTNSN